MGRTSFHRGGFTLIELAIVLVIIGLIVGGVLVGQNLIVAATVRAQIAQIEKYQTAVNTFRTKYNNYLPGDIPNPDAASFGFAARGSTRGQGDGNGVIEGAVALYPDRPGIVEEEGETPMFWTDLSTAGLIEGTFSDSSETSQCPSITNFLPPAKIGRGNYMYVWSGGMGSGSPTGGNSVNYFSFSPVTVTNSAAGGVFFGATGGNVSPGMTVNEAYMIDSKIDDGLPQSGRVTAIYDFENVVVWAGTTNWGMPPYTTATSGSSTSCFDNSSAAIGTPGVAGAAQHYSVEMNGGAGVNCGLSFQFQ